MQHTTGVGEGPLRCIYLGPCRGCECGLGDWAAVCGVVVRPPGLERGAWMASVQVGEGEVGVDGMTERDFAAVRARGDLAVVVVVYYVGDS